MEDLISREAAIKAVRNHKAFVLGESEWDEATSYWYAMAHDHICEVISVMPSAQTEIIRCKDCKHYQFADNRAFGMPVKMCKWFGFEDVDDVDFCSRAERKDHD